MRFFILTYALCLAAFFLKGLPALSFQAFTLLAICVYRKNLKSLLSLNHLTGIAIFVLFTTIYYYEYATYANTYSLFSNIISQSSQRTPIATDIIDSLIDLVQFPIQFILDFSPFSFFIFFVLRKNTLRILKENEFIFLSFLFIVSNIWLYWISSERVHGIYLCYFQYFLLFHFTYMRNTTLEFKHEITLQYNYLR